MATPSGEGHSDYEDVKKTKRDLKAKTWTSEIRNKKQAEKKVINKEKNHGRNKKRCKKKEKEENWVNQQTMEKHKEAEET